MALHGERVLANPLTRSTKAGRPYARLPEVESQLERGVARRLRAPLACVSTPRRRE
jgi:hypothetical protein